MTPDLIYDRMIGMGCASRLIFSWEGKPGVGSPHRLLKWTWTARRRVENAIKTG